MLKTNREKLVCQSVIGEITSPLGGINPYRIDPDGHMRTFPERPGTLVDEFQLLQRLHVEHENTLLEGKVNFVNPFAHT